MLLDLQSEGQVLAAQEEEKKEKAITKNNHTAAGNGFARKDSYWWVFCVFVCDSAHSSALASPLASSI